VYAAAIDQDQQLVGRGTVKTANADSPVVAIDAGHLDARCQAQSLGDDGGARAPYVLLADHIDRRRGLGEPLLFLRNRGNFDLHQLLKADLGQIDS